MTLAQRLADDVAARYGRDPWQIAEAVEARVLYEDLPGRHRELYVENPASGLRVIVLARHASAREQRELLAHGLAHYFLHVGDRLTGRSRAIWSGRHEREAEQFSAHLLVPDQQLQRLTDAIDGPSLWELCEHFDVSEELMERRLAALPLAA